MVEINKYIDHTLLKAEATEDDVRKLCAEAKQYKFFSVCINSGYVSLAKKELSRSKVRICAVVGFPLGAMATEVKVFEAKRAIKHGASEIDMVINVGQLKSKNFEFVEQEIAAVKRAIGKKVLKVIIETCYLASEEILLACEIAVKANTDFVKTSTGFGPSGANLEDIALMKQAVEGKAEIKASGGIKNQETALNFIEHGVSRIGTSSGVSIVKELGK